MTNHERYINGEITAGKLIELEPCLHGLVGGFGNLVDEIRAELDKARKAQNETTDLPSSTGRLEQAKRFAMMNFDHWNEVTWFPHPHTSYYYEIASLIEDAVEFGFGVAHGQNWKTIMGRIKQNMRPSTDEEKKSADEFLEKQFGIKD